MIRARSHMNVLLKLTLASACAAMVVLWPTWRVALQTFGSYQEGPRMTGSGTCTVGDVKVTHGFELHCDPSDEPNRLEVNWQDETGSHRFYLEDLQTAVCRDDQGFGERRPVAGFDTYIGTGTGRCDGVSDADVSWSFTDQGEPGSNDTLDIVITGNGDCVMAIMCNLSVGNHQAHRE